jgi:hypothetical protein
MSRLTSSCAIMHRPYSNRAERDFLLDLQQRALCYFLENQNPHTGLVLDRQSNFGSARTGSLCSTAATGMGFITLALGSAEPYDLLSRAEAVARVKRGVEHALHHLPHTHGVLPHFLDARTGKVVGVDARSTLDTGWFLAGALWAAEFLGDPELDALADQLFQRVDWPAWTAANGLLRHGADPAGRALPCCWDRLNGETVFLFVLAAGGGWDVDGWQQFGTFHGEVADLRFASADLGLFVFQYGLDLVDLNEWRLPGELDLMVEAEHATEANIRHCRSLAGRFDTFRYYWGLSAGDGPGVGLAEDAYRAYAPDESVDGTACLMATVASIMHRPAQVWENLFRARSQNLLGRYGPANVNLDRKWFARDMVAIDAGAAFLALDNALHDNRVRQTFHALAPVQLGLERLGAVSQQDWQRNAG